MKTSTQIAKYIREIHSGGNWTVSNLKEHLSDITWQQATRQVYSLNTIATLVFHMHYYVEVALKVLKGQPLAGSDKNSSSHPPLKSQQDWQKMLDKMWNDAETSAFMFEKSPDDTLWAVFANTKYGNYYRNLHGIIEHLHYHLGQVVLIKKNLLETVHSNPK